MADKTMHHLIIGENNYEIVDKEARETLEETAETLENKADIDGYYEEMSVGDAEQLIATAYTEDNAPYNFRTAGGSVDIGNREYVDEIVGGTIAWNQAIDGWAQFILQGGATYTYADGIGTAVLPSTNSQLARDIQQHKFANHKYLTVCDLKLHDASQHVALLGGSQSILGDVTGTTDWVHAAYMFTNPYSYWLLSGTSYGEVTVDIKNIMLFDLTQMFGSTIADYIYSLEQNTAGAGVAWFEKLFPKDYYEYNAGELMSVNVSEHNTVGFNQWDEEWEQGSINNISGDNLEAGTGRIRSKNFIPCIPNTSYCLYIGSGIIGYFYFYDINKSFLGIGSAHSINPKIDTTPSNCYYLKFRTNDNYGTTYNNDICINFSWSGYRNGEYEEYEKHTYELDSSLELRGIPKLDSSNNLYYDGDTYEADGTVTRKYGIVDLGTLSWNYDGEDGGGADMPRFSSETIADITSDNTSVSDGLICTKYAPNGSPIALTGANKTIARYNKKIYINDSSYTDAATFKAAMDGVYLVYELATPTTETADEYNEVQIVDDFGTEEYVDYAESQGDRDVAIPVGHNTRYPQNLRDKLQHLPNLADTDGDFIIRQSNKQMTLVESSEADLLEDMQILKDLEGYTGDIVGLQVDYQTMTCRRLGAAVGKSAGSDFNTFNAFGGRKDCIVTDGGVILAYYGETGYTETGALEVAITKDGTTYPIGTLVQVMVYQPKFYYKMVPLTLEKQSDGLGYHVRKANYYISDTPKQGFKLFPVFYDDNGDEVEYVLVGAYEGSIYDVTNGVYVTDDSSAMNATSSAADTSGNKFSSIAGVKTASGLNQYLTRPNMEILANNRGTGWHMQNAKFAMMDIWLMMIEFGTPNSQGGAGSNGVVSISDNSSYNCSANTGSTASLGNGSGQAASTTFDLGGTITTQTTNGKTSYRYRGMENPWGNIWKHIIGVNIWGDGTLKGGVPFICDDFGYAESKRTGNYKSAGFTVPNVNNYITALGYGTEEFDWLLMASETGASANSLINDYNYITANLNGFRIALLGGDWVNGAGAGALYWALSNGVGARARVLGGRLVYVPKSKTPSAA